MTRVIAQGQMNNTDCKGRNSKGSYKPIATLKLSNLLEREPTQISFPGPLRSLHGSGYLPTKLDALSLVPRTHSKKGIPENPSLSSLPKQVCLTRVGGRCVGRT